MDKSQEYKKRGHVSLEELLAPEVAHAYLGIMQKAMGDTPELQKRFYKDALAVSRRSLELYSQFFPFSLALLWGLTPTMEDVVGAKLLPAYAYGRVYARGAQLLVHNDRVSNEHSMTLTLGYADDRVWDFYIDKNRLPDSEAKNPTQPWVFNEDEYRCVKMQPGDAVAYQGVHYLHARPAPNPNEWSAHIFLGWVNRDGPYKDSAFDGLSLPPKPTFYFG